MIDPTTKYDDLVNIHGQVMRLGDAFAIGSKHGEIQYDDFEHFQWLAARQMAGLSLYAPDGTLLKPEPVTLKNLRRRRHKAMLLRAASCFF